MGDKRITEQVPINSTCSALSRKDPQGQFARCTPCGYTPKSGVMKNGKAALRVKRRDFYKVSLSFRAKAPTALFCRGWSREISKLWTETYFGRCLDFVPEKHVNSARHDRASRGQSRRFSSTANAPSLTAPLVMLKRWESPEGSPWSIKTSLQSNAEHIPHNKEEFRGMFMQSLLLGYKHPFEPLSQASE